MIKKVGGDQRQIHVPAFFDRFSAVHGFQHGQFARFFLNDSRKPVKVLSPLSARHFTPHLLISAPRGFDRRVNVGLVCLGNFAQLFFRRRIERFKIFS